MSVLRNIAIAVVAISFITFVALFGQLPALRRTPIGWLQRVLCLHIPNALRYIDHAVTGGRITSRSRRFGQYLFYEKNPIVLILFLFLMTGSICLFLPYAIPLLPFRLVVSIPFFVAQPYLFTYLCAAHRGHDITPSSHAERIHDYPFDHTLFFPGNVCSTCNLVKPARSKHCSFCGVCIAMCDHHCPWINNCVGRGNYRYFLALLFSLGVMEVYGAYLSYWILQDYLHTGSTKSIFSGAYWSDFLNIAIVAINAGGLSIAGVGMLAASTAALPLGLLAYHCYLIWAGMTTNESQKWSDLREDMADGYVFEASREALRAHNQLRRNGNGSSAYTNGSSNAVTDYGLATEESYVPWPLTSDQIVVRTMDGKPPTGQEALWSQVWKLNDIVNIYDVGGWDNFMEMLKGR